VLTNTGTQQAGRIVRNFAQLLLDCLIDDRSPGYGGLGTLAALFGAIAFQDTGQHSRKSVFTFLAGLSALVAGSACLLTGLGSVLCGLARLGERLGTGLVLLLACLLATAVLTLRLGRRGILHLLLGSTGVLVLGLFCFSLWRLAGFCLIGGF